MSYLSHLPPVPSPSALLYAALLVAVASTVAEFGWAKFKLWRRRRRFFKGLNSGR